MWRLILLSVLKKTSAYPKEEAALKQGAGNPKKRIERTGTDYKLWSFLNEHGAIRMYSRIGAVLYATYNFKFLIIGDEAN